MSEARNNVELKLEIKGASQFKFEYKGRLSETLDLALEALRNLKKILLYEEE
jgi:hypothetical protein